MLEVRLRASFLVTPQSTVALEGQSVRFTAIATGTPPLVFRWLKAAPFHTNTTGILDLTNLVVANSGNYRVSVTNILTGVSGIGSPQFTLTVLADADRDSMADIWEQTYGLSPTNAADALLDSDGDTMINLHEYIAGTDPVDPASYLKLEPIRFFGGDHVLRFSAVSNRSYTVQAAERLPATWSNTAHIEARSTNSWIELTNPPPAPAFRLYRLLTPRLP